METYIQSLIAEDSAFIPTASQVSDFFAGLVTQTKFQPVSPSHHVPAGPVVGKPTGLFWTMRNSSGESVTAIPKLSNERPQTVTDIPLFIESSDHYRVSLYGQWKSADRPLTLFKPDKRQHVGDYECSVRCECRPEPASTLALAPRSLHGPEANTATYPDPWTGRSIEAADASYARFWVELEFGDFLFPETIGSIQILNPKLVSTVEEHFQTKFVQGWRFY